uniref:RRM domain-containing protein n=1 Tax=Chromulina nebulosa TaxID=96789 RepID=A0A7S0SQW6_9STRA
MLYMIFSQYGKVIDIIACKGLKLRGQAWVVFQDITTATNALKGKQGFNFFGKPLKIAYSKTTSNIIKRKELLNQSQNKSKRLREDDNDINTSNKRINTSNKILFAGNLPSNITLQSLTSIFQQSVGFVEVRLAPNANDSSKNHAFIEFIDDVSANMALKTLHGLQLSPTDTLQLTISN